MFLRIPGSAQFLLELYVVNSLYVDVAVRHARRGLPRPLVMDYLYAPLSRSNTGRGEEDLMIFVGVAHHLARQVAHNNRWRLSPTTTGKGKGGAR